VSSWGACSSPYSFGDRLGVHIVALIRLHERLYKLRYDQPRIMALFTQGTARKMGSRTGFQTDQRRRHVRGVRQQVLQ
jgi:hypothetical protein